MVKLKNILLKIVHYATCFWLNMVGIRKKPISIINTFNIATMQNRFRELDIFSFSLLEGFNPITDRLSVIDYQ